MEDPRRPRLREPRSDASEAVYTRSADRSVPGRPEDFATLIDLPWTLMRLSGEKAEEMLNSVLTNQVPEEDHLGVYALLLNPKGRIQTDLRVLKSAGEVLLVVEPEGAAAARELLGRYAPFYRIGLEDLSGTEAAWGVIGLYGPRSGELLGGLELAEYESADVTLGGADLLAAGVAVPVPGYDLLGPADALDAAREHLTGRGAVPVGLHAYETARIAGGVPRFGADITPENFPGESENALGRAVNFGKGCYPGQETVARMRYRGGPNKKLYRFELEPGPTEMPEAGDEILQGEEELDGTASPAGVVGWLTSVAPLQVDGRTYALGYLARKADLEAPMRTRGTRVLGATAA
jgi:tRNA-modifying protein YgfZ